MAILTMRQAADTVGVSRSTIYRKVEEGILSLATMPDGAKGIDTSELIRVFGELKSKASDTPSDSSATVSTRSHATASNNHETTILKTQVELLRDQLEQAKERERRLLTMLEEEQRSRRELEVRMLPAPRRSFIDELALAITKLRESIRIRKKELG
jgi:excisionase family DNA binding protein